MLASSSGVTYKEHRGESNYYDNRAHDDAVSPTQAHGRSATMDSQTSTLADDETTNGRRTTTTRNCCLPVVRRALRRMIADKPSADEETPDDDHLGYPRERLKVLLCLGVCALAMMSNLLALAIIHDSVGRTPLPDVVFSLVEQQSWAWRAGDPMVAIMVLAVNILIVMHRHRWVLWRRWLCIIGTMYSLRLISLSVTQLPASFADNNASCRPTENQTIPGVVAERFFSQLLLFGLQGNNDGYLCGDLLFSGHTVQFSISCFMLNHYVPRSWWVVRGVASIAAFIGMVFMIICRSHYTVDIIIAYWLSTAAFSIFHAYVELPHCIRRDSSLSRLWLIYPLQWLEERTPAGKLCNHLQWPLNGPRCCVDYMRSFNREEEDRTQMGYVASDNSVGPSTMGTIHCVTGTTTASPSCHPSSTSAPMQLSVSTVALQASQQHLLYIASSPSPHTAVNPRHTSQLTLGGRHKEEGEEDVMRNHRTTLHCRTQSDGSTV